MTYWRTRTLRFLSAVIVLGGIIHICTVLAMPHLAPRDAWARITPHIATNKMRVLPAATAAQQAFAFMAPDIGYAACRYDLARGPVRIRARLEDDYWSIALYGRRGQNFHLVNGGNLKDPVVELTIHASQQSLFEDIADRSDKLLETADVVSPSRIGLVLIRAPLPNRQYRTRWEDILRQASCNVLSQ